MRGVDNHLIGVAGPGNQCRDIVGHTIGEGIAQRDRSRQRAQGQRPEASPGCRGLVLRVVATRRREQCLRLLQGDPALHRQLVAVTILRRQANLGARPAVAHHLPGVGGGVGFVHDQGGRSALARRLRVFVVPAPVVGHGIAVEQRRVLGCESGVIDQDDHGFAPHIDTGVIVPAPLRGIDPVADEHQLGVFDTRGGHLLLRCHHHLLAIGPVGAETVPTDRQYRRGVRRHCGDGDLLQPAVTVARACPQLGKMPDQPVDGHLLAGRSRLSPGIGILRQLSDVEMQVLLNLLVNGQRCSTVRPGQAGAQATGGDQRSEG